MKPLKGTEELEEFSLLGGPLHWLGCKMGLVQGRANTVRLGPVLGLFAWSVLVLFGLFQGLAPKLFTLAMIGVHVRLLFAIPLLFLSETRLVPRTTEFVRHIVQTGIVLESELPVLASGIRGIARLKNSWGIEISFLVLAFLITLWDPIGNLVGRNLPALFSHAGIHGLAYEWYRWFCLPFFRFLLLRWLWHLGLWWYFLWRLQKLTLRLIPIHPDRSGGLGYLEVVHAQFIPLIIAISIVLSATYAGEVSLGTMALESVYRTIILVLLVNAVFFVSPCFLFTPKLRRCREAGLDDYMRMAYYYVSMFDRKWVGGKNAPHQSPLGTPDIQSLADLTNSVDVIRAMRLIPMGRPFLVKLVIWACTPFLPLLLFKYPLDQLALRLLGMLTGL